jgi:heme oxygenase (mycobilin-producing)
MIKRIVKMSFHPENIEAFKNIFATNWKSIKGFEGCLHVELLQDELQPSQFFTYSLWESEAHLNVYRNSALFEQVWSATKALFNHKPQAWTLNEISFKD